MHWNCFTGASRGVQLLDTQVLQKSAATRFVNVVAKRVGALLRKILEYFTCNLL
jgi:hypothetical protein